MASLPGYEVSSFGFVYFSSPGGSRFGVALAAADELKLLKCLRASFGGGFFGLGAGGSSSLISFPGGGTSLQDYWPLGRSAHLGVMSVSGKGGKGGRSGTAEVVVSELTVEQQEALEQQQAAQQAALRVERSLRELCTLLRQPNNVLYIDRIIADVSLGRYAEAAPLPAGEEAWMKKPLSNGQQKVNSQPVEVLDYVIRKAIDKNENILAEMYGWQKRWKVLLISLGCKIYPESPVLNDNALEVADWLVSMWDHDRVPADFEAADWDSLWGWFWAEDREIDGEIVKGFKYAFGTFWCSLPQEFSKTDTYYVGNSLSYNGATLLSRENKWFKQPIQKILRAKGIKIPDEMKPYKHRRSTRGRGRSGRGTPAGSVSSDDGGGSSDGTTVERPSQAAKGENGYKGKAAHGIKGGKFVGKDASSDASGGMNACDGKAGCKGGKGGGDVQVGKGKGKDDALSVGGLLCLANQAYVGDDVAVPKSGPTALASLAVARAAPYLPVPKQVPQLPSTMGSGQPSGGVPKAASQHSQLPGQLASGNPVAGASSNVVGQGQVGPACRASIGVASQQPLEVASGTNALASQIVRAPQLSAVSSTFYNQLLALGTVRPGQTSHLLNAMMRFSNSPGSSGAMSMLVDQGGAGSIPLVTGSSSSVVAQGAEVAAGALRLAGGEVAKSQAENSAETEAASKAEAEATEAASKAEAEAATECKTELETDAIRRPTIAEADRMMSLALARAASMKVSLDMRRAEEEAEAVQKARSESEMEAVQKARSESEMEAAAMTQSPAQLASGAEEAQNLEKVRSELLALQEANAKNESLYAALLKAEAERESSQKAEAQALESSRNVEAQALESSANAEAEAEVLASSRNFHPRCDPPSVTP